MNFEAQGIRFIISIPAFIFLLLWPWAHFEYIPVNIWSSGLSIILYCMYLTLEYVIIRMSFTSTHRWKMKLKDFWLDCREEKEF